MGYGPPTHRRVVVYALATTWVFDSAPRYVDGVELRTATTGDLIDGADKAAVLDKQTISLTLRRGERGFDKWEALDGVKGAKAVLYEMRGRSPQPISGWKIAEGTITIDVRPDALSSDQDEMRLTITGPKIEVATREELRAGSRVTEA